MEKQTTQTHNFYSVVDSEGRPVIQNEREARGFIRALENRIRTIYFFDEATFRGRHGISREDCANRLFDSIIETREKIEEMNKKYLDELKGICVYCEYRDGEPCGNDDVCYVGLKIKERRQRNG
jgi:hypothetical protein